MKDLNLHEQIIKSLNLMVYDRSLPLNEQGSFDDPEFFGGKYKEKKPKKGEIERPSDDLLDPRPVYIQPTTQKEREYFAKQEKLKKQVEKNRKILKGKCDTMLSTKYTNPSDITAKKVFLALKNEIGDHWYDITKWGTSEKNILNALRLIKDKNTYNKILEFIDICYPESAGMTILEFIQSEEFSMGQMGLEKRVKDPTTALGIGYGTPVYAAWYMNDVHLKAYENILKKFNSNEEYSQENPYLEKNYLKRQWKTQVPPFAREVFHNAAMIVTLATMFFSGGSTAALFISLGVDLADAFAYWLEGDAWTAGLCLIFAFLPAGTIVGQFTKAEFKLTLSLLKESKELIYVKRGGRINKLTETQQQMIEWLTRKRNIISSYTRAFKLTIKDFIKKYDIFRVTKLILWLVKIGLLPVKYLLKPIFKFVFKLARGLVPVYVTWAMIADKLGIKQIEESKILKDMELTEKIGYRFSKIDPSQIITVKNGNTYNQDVLLLQLVLIHLGFNVPNTIKKPIFKFENGELLVKDSTSIKNFKIFNIAGQQVDFVENKNKSNMLKSKKIDKDGVFIVKVTDINGNSSQLKIFKGKENKIDFSLYNFNPTTTPINPKWGVLDKITENMIKRYQEKNKMEINGSFDSKLRNDIVKKISIQKKITRVRNNSGQPIKITVPANVDLTQEMIINAYKNKKKEVENDIDKTLDIVESEEVDFLVSNQPKTVQNILNVENIIT